MQERERPRRGAQRFQSSLTGVLEVPGSSHDCQIDNISAKGALVHCSADAEPGDQAVLDVPGIGRVRCAVMWGEGPVLGVAFFGGPDCEALILASIHREGLKPVLDRRRSD